MFSRRQVLVGSLALTASARVSAAPSSKTTGPAPAVPPEVKSFSSPYPSVGSVERLDPTLDALVAPDAPLEKLAEGFSWSEGPVWVARGGFLLFTDVPTNTIYKWQPGAGVSVFMKPAGYHGDRTDLKEPGANGLALDKRGRLLMCQHGNRRVARLASWSKPHGAQVALADKFDGKRFNSPNDLVVHSSGDLFFTDPPYGLARNVDDPEKELPFQGVYRLDGKGKVHLLTKELERPNGIALSPNGKTLYVANSHGPRPIWMAYDVQRDRSISNGRVFFDATMLVTETRRKGGNDGIAVDRQGNLFATGPGGVLVFSPQGKHLGTLLTGQLTANCKFGEDGSTLYITADSQLLRVKTKTRGLGF